MLNVSSYSGWMPVVQAISIVDMRVLDLRQHDNTSSEEELTESRN